MGDGELLVCPFCGDKAVLPVYWGYLPFDLAYKVEKGEALYGGAFSEGEAPLWGCERCGNRW